MANQQPLYLLSAELGFVVKETEGREGSFQLSGISEEQTGVFEQGREFDARVLVGRATGSQNIDRFPNYDYP